MRALGEVVGRIGPRWGAPRSLYAAYEARVRMARAALGQAQRSLALVELQFARARAADGDVAAQVEVENLTDQLLSTCEVRPVYPPSFAEEEDLS